MRLILFPFAIAAALAAGACSGPTLPTEAEQQQPGRGRPSAAQFTALEAQAEAACRCDRRRGTSEDEACWRDFNREIGRFQYSEGSTLCGPSSETTICFGAEEERETCLYRHRPHGACSAEEERQLTARNGGCGG